MLGEDAGLVGELVAFQFALLTQDADHPPLLLGQVMGVEGRAEERHGCFAGLQEGQGQGRVLVRSCSSVQVAKPGIYGAATLGTRRVRSTSLRY